MINGPVDLWKRIENFELDDPGSAFNFSDRLARENGWTKEHALEAVAEYKKFMYLLCLATHPLTPSDKVDQVWHLHLLYTESYWLDFCENVLQKKIHHGPTKGGSAEKNKFEDWYDKTLTLYREVFSIEPPDTLWPDKSRFRDTNFTRVNKRNNWIIPKPSFLRS